MKKKRNDSQQKALLIKNSKLQAQLSETVEEINEHATICAFKPKEKVMCAEKRPDTIFFILEGRAKIYTIHENGKRSLLQFLGKGDIIGELYLLGVEKQVKDVVAIDTLTCLALPLTFAKAHLLNSHKFMHYLSVYLAKKVLIRGTHFSNLQNYELKHRLATYILKVEFEGIYKEKQTETAEFLGVSYRHLSYMLKKFQQEGLLKKQAGHFLINRELLENLAIKNENFS